MLTTERRFMAEEEAIESKRSDPPSVEAVNLLGAVLTEFRNDSALRRYAEVDMRAIDEIRVKLQANPGDTQATIWVKQIAKTWSNRLRSGGDFRHIRRVLDLLDQRG
jgi:hypothetical protein